MAFYSKYLYFIYSMNPFMSFYSYVGVDLMIVLIHSLFIRLLGLLGSICFWLKLVHIPKY